MILSKEFLGGGFVALSNLWVKKFNEQVVLSIVRRTRCRWVLNGT